MKSPRSRVIEEHVRQFFAGHEIEEERWTLGRICETVSGLFVLRIAPGPRIDLWTYLTVGASTIEPADTGLLEFFILAPREDLRHVELLTMVADYHKSRHLGWGHTLPIGEPWLRGSACDHLIISTPYPFGAEFEICNFDDGHAHLFWLLPITEAERDFKAEYGIEALEQRFEDAELEYWDVGRASIV
jgi:hypothetical protein